jgi:hypothetical protein
MTNKMILMCAHVRMHMAIVCDAYGYRYAWFNQVTKQRGLFLTRLVGGEVQMGPLGTAATDWPIVLAPGDYDDGEFGEMKIGRGNRSTRRKPAPAPLCPPQIPLDQTPGSNPGRRGGKSATNRLSYCAVWRMELGEYIKILSKVTLNRRWWEYVSLTWPSSVSLSFLLLPLRSIGHPWNALLYFSFLILR